MSSKRKSAEKFINQVFSLKGAYAFGKIKKKSVEERLLHELTYQLRDLEHHWRRLMEKWRTERSFKEEIQYQRSLERVLFRLEELRRFLDENTGPAIIYFVCSEIYDFLQEKQYMESSLIQKEVNAISLILTAMNSFFLTEIVDLELITVEEIAQRLKESVGTLMERLH